MCLQMRNVQQHTSVFHTIAVASSEAVTNLHNVVHDNNRYGHGDTYLLSSTLVTIRMISVCPANTRTSLGC